MTYSVFRGTLNPTQISQSFSLDYIVLVLFPFVTSGSVSSVLHQESGWEERLWNDLFFAEWNVKP